MKRPQYKYPMYRQLLDTSDYHIDELVDKLFNDDDIVARYPQRVKQNIVLYACNFIKFGTVSIPTGHGYFVEHKHPFNTEVYADKALTLMKDAGYITRVMKGYRNAGYETGFSSIFEPTQLFTKVFESAEIPKVVRINTEILERIDRRNNHKRGNRAINAIKTLKKSAQMSNMNRAYFSRFSLNHPTMYSLDIFENVYLNRLPTPREQEIYGMRIYQCHGKSYQQLPYDIRKDLTINGEPTIEVDYSTLHLNMLYARSGAHTPSGDLYNMVADEIGIESTKALRRCIKHICMVAINAMSYKSFMSAYNVDMGYEIRKVVETYGIAVKDVLCAFEAAHPALKQYINSDIGIQLQSDDGDIMMDILQQMQSDDILGLPLHDSIICQKGNEDRVAEIMKEKYEEYTGYSIGVSVK